MKLTFVQTRNRRRRVKRPNGTLSQPAGFGARAICILRLLLRVTQQERKGEREILGLLCATSGAFATLGRCTLPACHFFNGESSRGLHMKLIKKLAEKTVPAVAEPEIHRALRLTASTSQKQNVKLNARTKHLNWVNSQSCESALY